MKTLCRVLKCGRMLPRAKAREALEAMTDDEDKALTAAALADPDALPLDEHHLARMRPVTAADAADIKRSLRRRPRAQTPKHR